MSINYNEAILNLNKSQKTPASKLNDLEKKLLLESFHPDHKSNAKSPLVIGVNKGDFCPNQITDLLQTNSLIDDSSIKGSEVINTDILVIGGGGAGCAAALTSSSLGKKVILATKLNLGDSNTIMAEGGIQAAVGFNDSVQIHFEDTFNSGHKKAIPELVKVLVEHGVHSIKWLIQKGVSFDMEDNFLVRKKPGGATRARILSYKDYTGLEIMRVLKEAASIDPNITLLNSHPCIELLTDDNGTCVGAVLFNLEHKNFILVRAKSVILATGGSGRLHLNDFPTSNHYGATADGLILAYRLGAKLKDMHSFQYHPTGLAYPLHLKGTLISEAARSAGAFLVNGKGQRFIEELTTRDVVASAILKEIAEGRGIERDGYNGIFLDTPELERMYPGIISERLVSLKHLAKKSGIDPIKEPLLIHPTLHYQNGGVLINEFAQSSVERLYCPGEISGGIHGENRMMGNALLDIITFGIIAGKHASNSSNKIATKVGLYHLYNWQRDMIAQGLDLKNKAPFIFPKYSNFDLKKEIQ